MSRGVSDIYCCIIGYFSSNRKACEWETAYSVDVKVQETMAKSNN